MHSFHRETELQQKNISTPASPVTSDFATVYESLSVETFNHDRKRPLVLFTVMKPRPQKVQ